MNQFKQIADKYKLQNTPIVLALGFYDSVHLGHQKITQTAIELAKKNNCKSAITTFKNCPLNKQKLVYSYTERVKILKRQKIDYVFSLVFDDALKNTEAFEFLDNLFCAFNVKILVCGQDYKFGKNASGNLEFLREFCNKKNIQLCVVPFVSVGAERVSSSLIKAVLAAGDIIRANSLLGANYHLCGRVRGGRGDGRKIGVPTININLPKNKAQIGTGVYATYVHIKGIKYNAITNVGAALTFNQTAAKIETHILNFSGDLCGKNITIYFVKRLRDVIKFSSIDELKMQLESDKKSVYVS